MPSGYFIHPLVFIVEIIFGFYLALLALRVIMRWASWEPSHPIVQLILRLTHPPIAFIRRLLPNALKTIGRWDVATMILLLIIALLKVIIIGALNGQSFSLPSLCLFILATLFTLFVTLFTASILIQVILSWLGPQGTHHPIAPLVSKMNGPLINPIRRRFPLIAGFDFSPLVALLGLQLLSMLVLPLLTAT